MARRQREKSEKLEQTRDKRPTAIAKYIRITSDKVGIVLDLIRGKTYEDAVAILNFTNKSASPVILKVLNSAAANAENNLNISKDKLVVGECWAMPGPTLKRMMPRARGSANRILKRTSHIRIILDEMEVKKPVVKETKKATKAASAGKSTATAAKQVPVTKAERPLTDTPNAKKPLGEKKVIPAKPAVKPAAAKTPAKKEAK
jgi:large subunit ribosomal protein L22